MPRPQSPPPPSSWLGLLARRLIRLKGWQRAGTAFGFGCVGALAFPPVDFAPILWLSFPALILCLQGTTKWWQAFITGWCFAFGLFVCGFYWIADAMFVDIATFWWAVPFAVAGLPAAMAIYYGVAASLAQRMGLKGFAGAVGFALIWFLADYARGHLFTGFPWNLEGYAWAGVSPMLQINSIIGIYGLTLITLVAACLPALLIDNKRRGRVIVILSLAVLVIIDSWGQMRLANANAHPLPDVANVRLRLVQPAIDQAHKWREEEREGNFDRILKLSAIPGEKPVTHIIWPETAATFYLAEDELHRDIIASHLPPGGILLTGVIRRDPDPLDKIYHYYNSLIAIDDQGQITATYDKHHLVPYGEYVPFREFIPIPAVASLGLGFSSGDGPQNLHVAGLPSFSPLICYEVIFPGEVAPPHDRPGFLLNVTNDGWYGQTAGPYQHFASARVRAIEEGVPLVRAANTGISGVVDAYGRVKARLGLGQSGFVDVDLPAALPPTFFNREGELPLWILFGVLAASIILLRVRGKK